MNKAMLSALALAASMSAGAAVGNINTQGSCNLSVEYQVPGISVIGNTNRSGVGVNDKFYVNYYGEGIRVYKNDGTLKTTIKAPSGYYLWVSCNIDAAGHLLVQLDTHAFNGSNSGGGNHGFMVIDTNTDQIIENFVPMTISAAYRYDAMAPVDKNIMTDYNTRILTVLEKQINSIQFSYNEVAGTTAKFWKAAAFATNKPETNTQLSLTMPNSPVSTSTGYAMQYTTLSGQICAAIYANPLFTETYSAEGKYGNAIRKYTGNWSASTDYIYTPQHSGLSAFNIFQLNGVEYIIYPSGLTNEKSDAFAISELTYINSPVSDMTMEGEKLVDGKPVGVLKALYDGTGVSGNTATVNSYNVEPVEGDANSVYIYVYANGAAGAKYKFTTGIIGEGEGTLNNPYNVERVADMISKAINANGKEVYVKGIVTAVTEVNTETGDALYTIETAASRAEATTITVSGKNLEQSNFTSADQLNAGDEVVVYGTIDAAAQRFNGYIYSLNGELSLPEVPRDPAVTATLGQTAAQTGYKLEALWTADNISEPTPAGANPNNRSGVGVNDKFYVNYYSEGVHVYNNLGKLIKVIPFTKGYHGKDYYGWVSCNADEAGHVLVQLDAHAFNGQCSANGGHGFMVIDSETDEVIADFVPMTLAAQCRFDAMSPVKGNIMENATNVWSVISGSAVTDCFNYNVVNGAPEYAGISTVETKVDLSGNASDQVNTGYAMEHEFRGTNYNSLAVYVNPKANETYSGQGRPGNGIRKFEKTGDSYTPAEWIYTPQHSYLPGFNLFKVYGHDYIIYPAGRESIASDAFAIAEVSFVDTPVTDTKSVGESSLGGNLIARAYAATAANGGNLYPGNTMTLNSYNVEPVEGDDHSVYIYMYGNGAPGVKYKFTLPADIATSVDEITVDDNAPVEYYNLQGIRVAEPTNGVYIMRQGAKVSKVVR